MVTGHSRLNCVSGLFTFLVTAGSLAAADATPVVDKEVPDHRVVLRLSDGFLNSVMDDQNIDRQTDVREMILGTAVYGKARVIAKPGVKLIENANDAAFQITLVGTIHSRTTGYNGPAIIHSRSITTFTASREVIFKAGEGFYAKPSKVSVRTESYPQGISSTWGGLIGRIVARRARMIEAARRPQATEIARQRIERRIKASFDRSSEARLVRLNQATDFRSLATAALQYGRGEPKYICSTTPHYLQIATSFGDRRSTIELPVRGAVAGAPIEIWLHESLLVNPITMTVDLLTPQGGSDEWMKLLSATAQSLGYITEVPGSVRSILSDRLQTHQVEDWRIVKVDVPEIVGTEIVVTESKPKASSEAPRNRSLATNRRVWTSGQFTADAEFLALEGNIVRLRRTTGVKTSIPIEKLSVADREWIQNYLARR